MGVSCSEKGRVLGLFAFLIACSIGVGCGLYYAGYSTSNKTVVKKDHSEKLRSSIAADNIDQLLKKLSSVPHIAGSPQDLEQAEWVRQMFMDYGLDKAEVIPYRVLLSYPDKDKPNKVYILDEKGGANFTTVGKQTPLHSPDEDSPLVLPNFNAFSKPGVVEGDGLVYVHYGKEAHYKFLEDQGIDVSGKIVIARFGGTFRGNIAYLAEKKGAIGLILYSDPIDFAQEGTNNTYPTNWWMPGTAVQLGSLFQDHGDPLTPFYPSIDGAYYIPEEEANLPSIPVQPIGYDEAREFFKIMKEGVRAPLDWQGGLDVTYYLGPELKYPGWKIKMDINTTNQMATIHNTIGMIYGDEEPDRYVIAGNHRDAWILGSLDPSGGTACMLEMARAFGSIKTNYGWRPRRTLIFASWGAEEYGLIGSTEWVEEHAKVLSQRTVAYLNIDVAVNGNHSLRGLSAPLIRNLLVESSKKIPNPSSTEVSNGRTSVYDTWYQRIPDPNHPEQPKVGILGSGSDFTPFMHNLGVPSMHFLYMYGENVTGNFPLYHTLHETHYLLSDILDPGFAHHRAITQLWTEIAYNLTEAVVLPMDIGWYAVYLTESFNQIEASYGALLSKNEVSLEYFRRATISFAKNVENFQKQILDPLDVNNKFIVRQVNDKLMQLERHFVDPRGLPNQEYYNHIVFAPSSSDSYASTSFAGLTDLLVAVGNATQDEQPETWAQIKQHLSVIAFLIEAAGNSLFDL